MIMLSSITFNLQFLQIYSDLVMLSSEIGLLKRPTIAVIVSAIIGIYFRHHLPRHLQGIRHGKL